MPLLKKLLYYCLLAVLTLAAIEGLSRLAYFLAFDQWYDGRAEWSAAEAPPRSIREHLWWSQHPFYGYTDPSAKDDLNRIPPRPGYDDTVLVALTGGSVAEDSFPFLERALVQHFAANNLSRRPVLLRLAMTGMQQPQQAVSAAYLLALGGHFDILVNLDGHNEIANNRINLEADTFPFFPIGWDKGAALNSAETLLVGRIALLRQQQRELSRAAVSPLRHTGVFALLNRYRLQRTTSRIIQLNQALAAVQAAYRLEKYGPRYPIPWWSAELTRRETEVWYRGSLLMAQLAGLAGAEYYHFQQPSQYVPGAKPLTAAELNCCYIAGGPAETQHLGAYPLLQRRGKKLRQQNVNYFDLNGIFADNHETLYRDACCHLNERGNELLAAAIVQRLSPALRRAAADITLPPPPRFPLSAAARPRSEELLIDGDFQVYRRAGRWLLYVKEGCAQPDTAERFFLHITPVNAADLPPERRGYGFDNRDFEFADAGVIIEGKCIVEQRLPHYAIAGIRTGQLSGAGEIWSGEYDFRE